MCETRINSEVVYIYIEAIGGGKKPYKCDTCGAAFKQKSHCTRHKKLVHQKNLHEIESKVDYQNHEDLNDLKDNKPPKLDDGTRITQDQFKCDKCNKSFGTTKAFTSHNYQVHPKPQKIDKFE